MPQLNIAIMGSRGIPNHYGGFEQLAQYLAAGLVKKGMHVTVYNSHRHPYRHTTWNGVQIIRCYDPEFILGTAGQFVYDLNCIRNAKKQQFDVILFLGYTSSSVFGRWYPAKAAIISNMDGLEWRRSKYSRPVQKFLRYAEKLAVKYSDHLIADSEVIGAYLENKYNTATNFIAYGAEISTDAAPELLKPFGVTPGNYYMLMARMEPENNIEMILSGFHQTASVNKFLVAGNTTNAFGKALIKKFKADDRICFAGAVYDSRVTHTLRKYCAMYFHGHSVGGTNPSLLEAMADKALIAAHNNEFNRAVLKDDAFYFGTAEDVRQLVHTAAEKTTGIMIDNNFKRITTRYNWEHIIDQYEELIISCHNK